MCICINCEFYKSCWMQNGLSRIDLYVKLYPKKLKTQNQNDFPLFLLLEINFFLNFFITHQRFELDVTECPSFCESAGKWI